MSTLLKARIKPYDEKRGHLTRRYRYERQNFDAEHGWYNVTEKLASALRTATVTATGVRIFDVVTAEEAARIDIAEAEAAEAKHHAHRPQTVMMTAAERAEIAELRARNEELKAKLSARKAVVSEAGLGLSDLVARYDTMSAAEVWAAVRDYSASDLAVVRALEVSRDGRGELLRLIDGVTGAVVVAEEEVDEMAAEAPIVGYDGLNIKEVLDAIEGADADLVRAVYEYEQQQSKPRSTLLRHLESKLD